jgi:hypothetical protein
LLGVKFNSTSPAPLADEKVALRILLSGPATKYPQKSMNSDIRLPKLHRSATNIIVAARLLIWIASKSLSVAIGTFFASSMSSGLQHFFFVRVSKRNSPSVGANL